MFSFSFAFHSSIGFADCQVTCTTEAIYSFTRRDAHSPRMNVFAGYGTSRCVNYFVDSEIL